MTKRDILSVAFKILGVVFAMNTVIYIPSIGVNISMIFYQPRQEQWFNPYWYLGMTILTVILSLTMAYILLKWGDLIAEKLIRENATISVLNINQWEKPAFILSLRIIGVVCLIKGIPQLVKALSELIFRDGFQGIIRLPHIGSGIIGAIVSLIIGIYLISGGKHLVEFAYREKTTTSDGDKIV